MHSISPSPLRTPNPILLGPLVHCERHLRPRLSHIWIRPAPRSCSSAETDAERTGAPEGCRAAGVARLHACCCQLQGNCCRLHFNCRRLQCNCCPPVSCNASAVSDKATAVGYTQTAVGYKATAVGHTPTAVGYEATAVSCQTPSAVGCEATAVGCKQPLLLYANRFACGTSTARALLPSLSPGSSSSGSVYVQSSRSMITLPYAPGMCAVPLGLDHTARPTRRAPAWGAGPGRHSAPPARHTRTAMPGPPLPPPTQPPTRLSAQPAAAHGSPRTPRCCAHPHQRLLDPWCSAPPWRRNLGGPCAGAQLLPVRVPCLRRAPNHQILSRTRRRRRWRSAGPAR